MVQKTPKIFYVGLAAFAAAAILLLYTLRIRTRTAPRPSQPMDAAQLLPEVPPAPEYSTVESMLREHEAAFAHANDASQLTLLMVDYFGCAALRDRSPELCKEPDRLAREVNKLDRDEQICLGYYRDGVLIWASEKGTASDCRIAGDECTPEYLEAARGGDPKAVCRVVEGDDKEEHRGADSALACEKEFAFVTGKPALCADISNPRDAKFCPIKAALVRALREGKPEPAAGTVFAPLVDKSKEACRPLAEKVFAEYRRTTAERAKLLLQQAKDRAAKELRERRLAEEKERQEKLLREIREKGALQLKAEQEELAARRKEEALRLERERLTLELETAQKYEQAKSADEAGRRAKGLPMRDKKDKAPGPPSKEAPRKQ